MELYLNLTHPNTLVVGEQYILIDRYVAEYKPVLLDVKFVSYTSCPAIVAVLVSSGQKVRILRDDLYTKS